MSDWQQYDYDKDGYLESGRELQDYAANEQREAQEYAQQAQESIDQLEQILLREFWDATQQGSHYLLVAGEALADTAVLVAQAAEVVDWLGTAFRWLGYIVPGAGAVAEVLEKVENVSEEKALKASFYALTVVMVDGLELAFAGWDAMNAGRVTDEARARAVAVVNHAVEVGTGITDILFD